MADFVNMKKAGNSISYGKIFGVLAGILLVLIVIFNTFISVDSGHSGIVTTFGKVNDRITSYNVCYTKLLRLRVSKNCDF